MKFRWSSPQCWLQLILQNVTCQSCSWTLFNIASDSEDIDDRDPNDMIPDAERAAIPRTLVSWHWVWTRTKPSFCVLSAYCSFGWGSRIQRDPWTVSDHNHHDEEVHTYSNTQTWKWRHQTWKRWIRCFIWTNTRHGINNLLPGATNESVDLIKFSRISKWRYWLYPRCKSGNWLWKNFIAAHWVNC